MTFEVKTRNAKGGIEYIRIEAADRATMFGELKKIGVNAISVEVITGKSKNRRVPKTTGAGGGKPVSGVVKGVLALVAVCLIGAVVWLCGSKDEPESPVDEVPKPRKMVPSQTPGSISIFRRQTEGEEFRQTNEVKVEKPKPVLGRTPTGEEYVAVTAVTNDDGVVRERYQLPDGRFKSVIHLQRKEMLAFDNDFDQFLSSIATIPLDQDLPPTPDMGDLDEAFKNAIKTPIVIYDSDSDKIKEMKRAAILMRNEISALVAEGYSVAAIIADHQNLRADNIELRQGFQQELNEIYRSGDQEKADLYFESINKVLGERGLLPLKMPGSAKGKRRSE